MRYLKLPTVRINPLTRCGPSCQKALLQHGEIAEAFDVNPSLNAFLKKEFEILTPKKNTKDSKIYRTGY